MERLRLMLLLLLLCSPDLLAADFFSEPAYVSRLKKKQTGTPPEPPSWTPSNLTALVSWWNPDYSITNASGEVTNFFDIIGGKHLTNPVVGRIPTMVTANGQKALGMRTNTMYLRCQTFAEPLNNVSFIFILHMTNRFSIQNFCGSLTGTSSRKSSVNLQTVTSAVISGFNQTNKFCIITHVKWNDGAWRESLMTNGVIGLTANSSAGFTNIYVMNGTGGSTGQNGIVGDCFFLRTNANAAAMAGDISNLYVWATNKYGVF